MQLQLEDLPTEFRSFEVRFGSDCHLNRLILNAAFCNHQPWMHRVDQCQVIADATTDVMFVLLAGAFGVVAKEGGRQPSQRTD